MQVTAHFAATPAPASTDIIYIQGLGNYPFLAAQASISGSDVTITMTCSTVLASTVDFLNSLTIEWQYSYNGDPQNGPWTTAGTSTNRVYVVLAQPAPLKFQNNTVNSNYETVLDISCRNAKGKSQEADVVSAIYNGDFAANAGSGVRRKQSDGYNNADNINMHYYRPGSHDFNVPITMAAMLSSTDGVGNCLAWAELFLATLRVQGITNGGIVRVVPISSYDHDFLVNNWQFNGMGTQNHAPYLWLEGTDCLDEPGVAGQGNPDPDAWFGRHWVVGYPNSTGSGTVYNGSVYDPSYGHLPFSTTLAHEKASICGFDQDYGSDGLYARKRVISSSQAELMYTNDS